LVEPRLTAVTVPELFTVATPGAELVQAPPEVASLRAVVEPIHAYAVPVIAAGCVFIVTIFVAGVPQPIEYVIVQVPAETPVTIPVDEPTVALAVLLLIHEPPPVVLANVVDDPAHIVAVPVIAATELLTVTILLALVPHPVEYVILAVPAVTPETTPVEELTVAIARLELVHVPLATELLNVTVDEGHSTDVPVMAAGTPFTVTSLADALLSVPLVLHRPVPFQVIIQ
jgi:hypothetical protein